MYLLQFQETIISSKNKNLLLQICADGSSNLRCELSLGVTDVIPVVYYLPREGCPSGSKLTYKGDDGTELCCRTRAVYSDKPVRYKT